MKHERRAGNLSGPYANVLCWGLSYLTAGDWHSPTPDPLNGAHGAVGTASRVVMQMGQRKIECTETITRREPADLRGIPPRIVVHFDREIVGEGMWNVVRDRLTEAGPETTLWVNESEYRFSGLLMRLVGRLMLGAFRKQSQQHMQDFKAFAEQGKDVREGTG